jgi:outer membrane immunogenic protein
VTFANSRTGAAVGGGIEAALIGNWTAKAEYLYIDLGSISATIPAPFGWTVTSPVRDHVARIGLNYKFDDPLLTKY